MCFFLHSPRNTKIMYFITAYIWRERVPTAVVSIEQFCVFHFFFVFFLCVFNSRVYFVHTHTRHGLPHAVLCHVMHCYFYLSSVRSSIDGIQHQHWSDRCKQWRSIKIKENGIYVKEPRVSVFVCAAKIQRQAIIIIFAMRNVSETHFLRLWVLEPATNATDDAVFSVYCLFIHRSKNSESNE